MPDTITMDSPARDWIIQALENDPDALHEGIRTLYNCKEAIADNDGDIWIAGPMTGHYLDADGLERIARALKAGDI